MTKTKPKEKKEKSLKENSLKRNKDFSSADVKVSELAKQLRDDKTMQNFSRESGIGTDAFDTICGVMASYPLKLLAKKPADITERKKIFLREINRFNNSVWEYETGAACQVISLNGFLEPWELPTHYPNNQNDGSAFDIRNIKNAANSGRDYTIQDYLACLLNKIENDTYESTEFEDLLLHTPNGKVPTTDASKAAWLAIKTLDKVRFPRGTNFNKFAAYCASVVLCFSFPEKDDVSSETIAQILRDNFSDVE